MSKIGKQRTWPDEKPESGQAVRVLIDNKWKAATYDDSDGWPQPVWHVPSKYMGHEYVACSLFPSWDIASILRGA